MATRARRLLVTLALVTAAAPSRVPWEPARPAKEGDEPRSANGRDDDSGRSRPEREPIVRAHEASPERPRTDDGPPSRPCAPPDAAKNAPSDAACPSPPPPPRIALLDTRAGLRSTPPPLLRRVAPGR